MPADGATIVEHKLGSLVCHHGLQNVRVGVLVQIFE